MKNVFLLIGIVFVPYLAYPQASLKKADTAKASSLYLGFSVGLSQPLGSYTSTDVKNFDAGFATPGSVLQVNFDWLGINNIGLALEYAYQRNPLNSSVKNDTLRGTGKPNQPLGIGNWTNHYLMAGIAVTHFFDKVYVEGRALFGFVISSTPVFKTMDVSKNVSTNVGTGLAGGVQLGVGYSINPRVTVKANIEYLLGRPGINKQYKGEMVLDTITHTYYPSALQKINTKLTVSSLLIKAGVVIKLSK